MTPAPGRPGPTVRERVFAARAPARDGAAASPPTARPIFTSLAPEDAVDEPGEEAADARVEDAGEIEREADFLDPIATYLSVVVAEFRRWMHMPDLVPLLAVLACVAANIMTGDPVWLMLVGPPSSGKTQILNAISTLARMHSASVLSEQALLSGTPVRDHGAGASGGLLRQIGTFGFILLKDFTSLLSIHRDKRAP